MTVVASAIVATATGCGVGAGERDQGFAALTVTRDHGSERLLDATLTDPAESDSVVRFLDAEAEIETSYGGNFVDSIEGIEGTVEAGRQRDWFFYVNGYWSPVGAGEARVRAGDEVWWDYRDWTNAYRVPAVVGSYPEPFVNGFDGERFPTEVICFAAGASCDEVADRLAEAGVQAPVLESTDAAQAAEETLRVLVGEWGRVREDDDAATLARGPGASGVYAVPERCGAGWVLSARDERDRELARLGEVGWVAAVRRGEDQPTWIVSATSADSLPAAVALLDEELLTDRYAAISAAPGAAPASLPVGQGVDIPVQESADC